jgi:hypothetical protein
MFRLRDIEQLVGPSREAAVLAEADALVLEGVLCPVEDDDQRDDGKAPRQHRETRRDRAANPVGDDRSDLTLGEVHAQILRHHRLAGRVHG